MRILLVWPRNRRAVLSDRMSCCEPLPLEYLAGALRPDHDVGIHDLRLDGSLDRYAERNDACAFIHAPTDEDVTAFIRLDGNRLQCDRPGVSVDNENRRTIALIEQCGERETRDPFAGGVGQGQCRRHSKLHCITCVRN